MTSEAAEDHGTTIHQPVMVREVTEFLNVRRDGFYIDATLGGTGHAQAILSRLGSGRLLGIDRDPSAVAAARGGLAAYGEKVTLVQGNFGEIDRLQATAGFPPADGIVADLGLSSTQLADRSRGKPAALPRNGF